MLLPRARNSLSITAGGTVKVAASEEHTQVFSKYQLVWWSDIETRLASFPFHTAEIKTAYLKINMSSLRPIKFCKL